MKGSAGANRRQSQSITIRPRSRSQGETLQRCSSSDGREGRRGNTLSVLYSYHKEIDDTCFCDAKPHLCKLELQQIREAYWEANTMLLSNMRAGITGWGKQGKLPGMGGEKTSKAQHTEAASDTRKSP